MGKTKNAGGRKLVVLSGITKGTAFVLKKTEVKAGRGSDNAICLKGKRVSLHHAILVRTNGEYTLRDVSTRVGTLLNGRRTKEAHLKLGDRIRIGEFEMSYEAATARARRPRSTDGVAQPEEPTALDLPVIVESKEIIEEPAVENPAPDHQLRIAELLEQLDAMARENAALALVNGERQAKISEIETSLSSTKQAKAELMQESERLAGEMKLANEALETLRAELQLHLDIQGDLKERLGGVCQENVGLVTLNRELEAKVSEMETSATEMGRVKAELMQEKEQLASEMNLANEALEPLRAQLQRQSELQVDLTEQLGTMSQENAGLAKLNNELQAKISEMGSSLGEVERVETELVIAQAALRQMGEDLAKARESAKPDANAEAVVASIPYSPARGVEEREQIQIVPMEVHSELGKVSDVPMELVTVESEEERMAAAKTQEEATARRGASEQTNEQFDKIRQTIVEKKNQKPKSMLDRFLLPFRDTRIS